MNGGGGKGFAVRRPLPGPSWRNRRLEEQCRAGRFGLGIGEAIAEIQLRGMLRPLPVAGESVQRAMRGARLDRYHLDTGEAQKLHDVGLCFGNGAMPLPPQSERRFIDRDRRGRGAVGLLEGGDQRRKLRFARQDRDDSGGVDNDHDSPLSSSKKALSASRPVAGRLAMRSWIGRTRSSSVFSLSMRASSFSSARRTASVLVLRRIAASLAAN